MTFKLTDAEKEAINALENYAMGDTLDRLWPKIEQVLAPRWDALDATVERLSADVTHDECLAFERSYGEKLMLNYVEVGLDQFLESRKAK